MKKIFIQLAMLLCFSVALKAQDLELKWSEKFIYDNKLDGFFNSFVGSNTNYIYGRFSNLNLLFNRSKKSKILAFDKTTMKKVGDVELYGYSDANDRAKKDMYFYKTIVLENVIYVLWSKEKSGVTEIFAESFDSKLKRINSLKKIYEYNSGKKNAESFAVMCNKDINNKILICKEYATLSENENLKIEYKLINEDFSISNSGQVTLPIIVFKKGKRDGLVCSYQLADDGNIYVEDKVKITGDEKKKLKKGEASAYPVIMQIKPENGALKEYSVKFAKKNTFNFSWLVSKNSIRLYGFFCDLDKDVQGNDTHGIFHISMDQNTFEPIEEKFSYFDKQFLDKLYAADKENQKKGKGLFKSKEAKESDNESIDDNYVIESTIEDGKDILLFCSIMYNWQRTVCTTSSNGATSCQTYYYCTKSNVTTFRLSESGEIIWASNLDRVYTYSNWNVYDLSVVKQGDEYIVVYQSLYQILGGKKKKNRKSKQQMNDRFEYAVFQGKTGDYKKAEYQVNGFNTKKADSKYVNASDISVFDNKMFTSCSKTKYKPTTWISCLCPPVFYYLSFSGNSRKGAGYLGTINTLK